MSNEYSVDDLLSFLDHAAERGLIPPATATALAVASRNVFSVLSDDEKKDLRALDLGAVAKRFQNKRAKDFTGPTLKEYERRVHRAVKMFISWRDDPANFRAPTRSTSAARKRRTDEPDVAEEMAPSYVVTPTVPSSVPSLPGTYSTAIPLGPGRIVELRNVPADMTPTEAQRLAAFVKMLATEG